MMRRFVIGLSVVVGATTTLPSSPRAAGADVACNDTNVVTNDTNVVTIRRLGKLPPDARAAIGEMAESGEPFQMADALSERDRLPWRRFQTATVIGCRLHVDFEFGGRTHGFDHVDLEQINGVWGRVGHHPVIRHGSQ